MILMIYMMITLIQVILLTYMYLNLFNPQILGTVENWLDPIFAIHA